MIPGLGPVTSPTSAQAISPDAVQQLAEHAQQHDAGIVDRMSALYAAHPGLIRTLGNAAMMIALRTMAQRHQPS